MTDKEYRLGQENAKLARKIHRQRLVISQRGLTLSDALLIEIRETAREVSNENIALKLQNKRLQTENRALRIYIAEEKAK